MFLEVSGLQWPIHKLAEGSQAKDRLDEQNSMFWWLILKKKSPKPAFILCDINCPTDLVTAAQIMF